MPTPEVERLRRAPATRDISGDLMPSFYTRAPHKAGIAGSVRALLSSSPNLSEADILKGHAAAASAEHNTALAEKIRLEIAREQQADRARSDPSLQNEYGATTSGITVPQGAQLSDYIRGVTSPPATPVDDQGYANPQNPPVRPDVTPEAERGYRSAIGALIANRLATGKTNAEQLTHGQGNLLTQAVRGAMSGADNITDENQLGHSIGVPAREPFTRGPNPQGVMVNQETGDLTTDTELHDAAVKAAEALAAKRAADATKTAGPRLPPGRTPAQEGRDVAYAERQRLEAESKRMEILRQKQSGAKSRFRNDRNMKGNTIGNWVPDAGFEVLDSKGKVVGHYD